MKIDDAVRELVWRKIGEDGDFPLWLADTSIGRYEIVDCTDDDSSWFATRFPCGPLQHVEFPTLEAAKQAAQSHFVSQIAGAFREGVWE